MVLNNSWKNQPNGCLTAETGDVRILVEKVGAGFRVVVTRSGHQTQPEIVLASASAPDVPAAMALAERVASRLAA